MTLKGVKSHWATKLTMASSTSSSKVSDIVLWRAKRSLKSITLSHCTRPHLFIMKLNFFCINGKENFWKIETSSMVIILDMQIKPFRCLVDSRQARIVMACISVHFWKGGFLWNCDYILTRVAITVQKQTSVVKIWPFTQWYFFDEFSALRSKYSESSI